MVLHDERFLHAADQAQDPDVLRLQLQDAMEQLVLLRCIRGLLDLVVGAQRLLHRLRRFLTLGASGVVPDSQVGPEIAA